MKEHNNRKKAKNYAEYITGQSLRKYVARKVKQYTGESPTLFDGAAGSGQLAQHINFKHLTAVEIQSEACEALTENFSNANVWNGSFFNYQNGGLQVDCVVMNPPFSIKFKDLSKEEQDNIKSLYSWKKSGVVDDMFVLKAMQYSSRYGVFILFPGVGYRGTEKNFRKELGASLVELNTIRNGFEDTAIEVLVIVVDKHKTDPIVKREIYDCKTDEVVFEDEWTVEPLHWETAHEPTEDDISNIDIDELNTELDDIQLDSMRKHLAMKLATYQIFGDNDNVIEWIEQARDILLEFELEFQFMGGNGRIL